MRWKLAWAFVLMGCQLVWDPAAYRGSEDGGVDAPGEDTGDGDPDVGVDSSTDALIDAPVDSPTDASIDADADRPDCLDETIIDSVTLSDPDRIWQGKELIFDGDGAALTIDAPGVVVRNVDITVSGTAHGIVLTSAADDVTLENVRVTYKGETIPSTGMLRRQLGLLVEGESVDEVENLRVANFLVDGLEGVRLVDTVGNADRPSLVDVHVVNPAGRGDDRTEPGANRHAGISLISCSRVQVRDFAITGGALTHAVYVESAQNVSFGDGFISTRCEGYPVLVDGSGSSQMTNLSISGSRSGVQVQRPDWSFMSIVVERTADCGEDDYAYSNPTGNPDNMCLGCRTVNDECGEPPVEAWSYDPADGELAPAPMPLSFCFGAEF